MNQLSESPEPEVKTEQSLAKTRAQMLVTVLRYQGVDAAEAELEKIAHTEGDMAVMQIAPHLSSAEVRGVTAAGDIVKPSLLHTAITPEQFLGVFRRVGSKWAAAEQDDCAPYDLEQFQEELKQFLCAFVLLQDDEKRRQELLRAILDEPHGPDALIFATIHEKDFDEFVAAGGKMLGIGDWREVVGILPLAFPSDWECFVQVASGIRTNAEYRNFVHTAAAEIYAVACADGAVQASETEKADELFTPLL